MYVTRRNEKVIFKSFDSPLVTALLGPRRVGKTTLVQHFVENNPEKKWVLLNMDSRAECLRVEAGELSALIEERARQKIGPQSPLWIAIDEAQKSPPLFEQIKILYDRYKDTPALKFILTGSGFLSLHQMAAENLAGRIEIFHLREFGLRESLALHDGSSPTLPSLWEEDIQNAPPARVKEIVSEIAPHQQTLRLSLTEQLLWGGLPEVLQNEGEENRIGYLANYLQTYLEKDVRAIPTISDLNLYQKMMEIIAQQTGSLRDDKRMVDALSCSRDTLKKYRGYLEATLFYQEIFPFIGSALKRLVKSPKGYLTNNGLISYLTGIYDLNALEKTGSIGHRYENWLLKELQIWLDRDPRRSAIHFWRTSGGVEVDFVVEKPPFLLPWETTYSSRIDRKKVKHLQAFLREEKRAKVGLYVYNGDFLYDEDSKILFLPSWAVG